MSSGVILGKASIVLAISPLAVWKTFTSSEENKYGNVDNL
jgi:hypothetical protein